MDQIKIPDVHDKGYKGTGIIICVMDAGVSNLQHEVFNNIKIEAQYNFLNNTTTFTSQPDWEHGTYTLALIGGFNKDN